MIDDAGDDADDDDDDDDDDDHDDYLTKTMMMICVNLKSVENMFSISWT